MQREGSQAGCHAPRAGWERAHDHQRFSVSSGTRSSSSVKLTASSDGIDSTSVDLEQVFAAARSALCILRGPEHRWEKVNTVYKERIFLGTDLIARTVREVVPDGYDQGFGTLLDKVYATEQPQHGREVRLEAPGRPPMYFNVVYAPIRDTRSAINGIFVEAHDVTEQVVMRQALETAEANYRSIFE